MLRHTAKEDALHSFIKLGLVRLRVTYLLVGFVDFQLQVVPLLIDDVNPVVDLSAELLDAETNRKVKQQLSFSSEVVILQKLKRDGWCLVQNTSWAGCVSFGHKQKSHTSQTL